MLFIHGLESSPQGSKAVFLAQHFEALTSEMDTHDFGACVALQTRKIASFAPEIVVGSSFGGAVLLDLLQRGAWAGPSLFLAPAHRHYSIPEWLPTSVAALIVHGTRDSIVDIAGSRALSQTGSRHCVRLIEVDDEHRLQSLVDTGRLAGLVHEVYAQRTLDPAR